MKLTDWLLSWKTNRNCVRRRRSAPQRSYAQAVEMLESRTLLTTFVVTTTADVNPPADSVTLRQAIMAANENPGADTIAFDIGSGGHQSIAVQSALPTIMDTVTIDGTTQPGYAGTPLIEINGAAAGITDDGTPADGLRIGAGSNTVVQGLDITGFAGQGINADGWYGPDYLSGIVVEDCYLGVDSTGNTAVSNENGLLVSRVDGIRIANNVISGNTSFGVEMNWTQNSVIVGNFVGTNAAGTAAVGNGSDGIALNGSPVGNCIIGGADPGDRNIISGNLGTMYANENGNSGNGIYLAGAVNVTIQGNFIGTDVTGTAPLGNAGNGITGTFSSDVKIGGINPGDGNLISANGAYGGLQLVLDSEVNIQGNFIGTDATGTVALTGQFEGMIVQGCVGVVVGGTASGARNLISGNAWAEIDLRGSGTTIEGNYLGTDVTGTVSIDQPGGGQGVYLGDNATNNLIGGTSPGAGNLIAGDDRGIEMSGSGVHDNTVFGNRIGTDVTGLRAISGSSYGVFIEGGASSNIIGGVDPGQANVIRDQYVGVAVVDQSADNSIRGNSFAQSAGIPISFLGIADPNDPLDADNGPNDGQNNPNITSATVGNATHVTGTLDSTPNATFTVDFYAGTSINQAVRYIGTTTVSTDAAGHATFDLPLTGTTAVGETIFATATNAAGSTSQMSPAATSVSVQSPSITMAIGGTFIYDGTSHAGSGTVNVAGGIVTLSYTGINGTIYSSTIAPTNAGSYLVTATYAGDASHTGSSGTAALTIAKATLPVLVTSDLMLASQAKSGDGEHEGGDDCGDSSRTSVPALTGTVNGVTFTGHTTYTTAQGVTLTITLSSTVTASSPVGVYPIIATVTGAGGINYVQPTSGNMYVVTVGHDSSTGAKNVSFWDNKGNAKLITVADLSSLDQLNLKNVNGSNFDPTTAAQLDTWLTSDSEQIIKSLSVQLAVMDLNILSGNVKLTDVVYASDLLQFVGSSYSVAGLDGGGFISVGNLMTLANSALNKYATAAKADDNHSQLGNYLDALEDTLEAANNNTSFVQQAVPTGI